MPLIGHKIIRLHRTQAAHAAILGLALLVMTGPARSDEAAPDKSQYTLFNPTRPRTSCARSVLTVRQNRRAHSPSMPGIGSTSWISLITPIKEPGRFARRHGPGLIPLSKPVSPTISTSKPTLRPT